MFEKKEVMKLKENKGSRIIREGLEVENETGRGNDVIVLI